MFIKLTLWKVEKQIYLNSRWIAGVVQAKDGYSRVFCVDGQTIYDVQEEAEDIARWCSWGGRCVKLRNHCRKCKYYHPENNTCQSKKCATGGPGYVTVMDRLFCKPYIPEEKEEE